MFSDLAFLYLDLPKFQVDQLLIDKIEKVVYEDGFFEDKFRNCRHIPIYVTDGNDIKNTNANKKWSKQSEQLPEVKTYIEKFIKPIVNNLGRIVIICTKPGEKNPTHIDCSRKNFANNTLEHKFRVVLRGQTNNLYFNGQDKNYYVKENLINQPFVMSGSWPHTMINEDNTMKFTLAMGSPWEAEEMNTNYIKLLERSYMKYKNSFISKKNMKMPKNINSFFSK